MAAIRRMELSDLPWVVNLAYDMHGECHQQQALGPVEAPWVTRYLESFLTEANRFAWVAEVDGHGPTPRIVGFNGLIVSAIFFREDLEAHQTGLYITPEYRGGVIAEQLMTAAIDIADNLDCLQIIMGVTGGVRHERIVQMLKRCGMSEFGPLMRRVF